jgi:phosphomevalonate kinase
MTYKIIALSGKAGVGKDYIAQCLDKHTVVKTLIVSFADQIKMDCIVRRNLSFDNVYNCKDEKSREVLQQYGTEEGRDVYGKDMWCEYLENWMNIHYERNHIKLFIITDCRFRNEIDWVRKMNGYVIRVIASDRGCATMKNGLENHVSEIELDEVINSEFDMILNNAKGVDLNPYLFKILYENGCSGHIIGRPHFSILLQ